MMFFGVTKEPFAKEFYYIGSKPKDWSAYLFNDSMIGIRHDGKQNKDYPCNVLNGETVECVVD